MGHLSWNCAPTSCRHVITHMILILLPCSSTVPRRPAPGCKELRHPHTNCAAVDNSSCLQVEEQFVRPRPLHVAQPHRHPHGSRTRPGHCGPPLTTAGVRQRGCSPSDGVSAMTRGAVHEITNKRPHNFLHRLTQRLHGNSGLPCPTSKRGYVESKITHELYRTLAP